jgi:hypothetical protein
MYQFSVQNPKDTKAGIQLIRSLTTLSIQDIKKAIENNLPVVSLSYRDDIVTLEFEEWIEKVKTTYVQLSREFETITIGYTLKNENGIELIDQQNFFSLLNLELEVHNEEHA